MKELKTIAVLIDADNTQLVKLESTLHELSTYGRIVAKKAYGNWKKPVLKNWEEEVKRLAIKTVQQFDYVSGKNTTDIVMVIDAMDMLHTQMYDAFALVSSDSDFTPLAIRLRESGSYIIGVGEDKTPEAFRNACDDFILLEYLDMPEAVAEALPEKPVPAEEPAPAPAPAREQSKPTARKKTRQDAASRQQIGEIHNLLRIGCNKYQDEDGYTDVSLVGTYIKRAKPDFDTRAFGYSKLTDLIKAFPKKYELKRTADLVIYKCL